MSGSSAPFGFTSMPSGSLSSSRDRLSLEAILGGVAAVRVPQFAVRLVMLAVPFLLTGVVAAASGAWAVGYTGRGTLIARWHGTIWKRVRSPGSAGTTWT